MAFLASIYMQYMASSSAVFDWCGCGHLSTGQVVGIAVGCGVFVALVVVIIIYCVKKKKSM